MSVLLCLVGLHSLQLGGQATVEGMELLKFAAGENQEDVILHVLLVLSYFYTVYIIVHVVSFSLNGHILILVPLLQLR